MTDERFNALLRVLDAPAVPDDAFAERLYGELAARAGFRGGAPAHWLDRIRFGPNALAAPLRLVWLVLLSVALLAALAMSLVLVGSAQERPEDIVKRSQAVLRSSPPFAMTTRFADGSEARYLFDGRTLRLEVTKGRFFGELPEGWFFVRDAEREASYDPEANFWSVGENRTGWPLFQLEPSWVAPVAVEAGEEQPLATCTEWQLGEEVQVAGRTADEVRCGSDSYWVDRESGLLVKRIAAGTASPAVEVVALAVDPTLAPELFAFEPPPGAKDSDDPPPLRPESDVLVVGEPAPPWTGTLLDGGVFSTDELRGRPAALFIWCACASGPQVQAFAAEARFRSESMKLVLVSLDQEGTIRGLVDWLGMETPVVHDQAPAEGSLLETWRLSSFPALILFRADGMVADIHPASFSATKLTAVLDALAAGETIPEPDSRPAPIVDEQGRQPLSSVLEVGQLAPELRGPSLGGGELSTRDVLGRPTVVLHWNPRDAGGRPPDDAPGADRLLAEAARRAGELNVLLIANGEPTPGAVARYLGEQGTDVPVIFDWDGTLHQRWGLLIWPTLVLLDADGRVAGYYGPDALADPAALLDALQAGEPLPSPSPEWF